MHPALRQQSYPEILFVVLAGAIAHQQRVRSNLLACDHNRTSAISENDSAERRLQTHLGIKPSFQKTLLYNANKDATSNAAYLHDLLQGCNEVCNTSIAGSPGKYFNEVKKKVDCIGLFGNLQSDAPATTWPPPKVIPDALKNAYVMGGAVTVSSDPQMFFQQRYSGRNARTPTWTKQEIEEQINLAAKSKLNGTYGVKMTNIIRQLIEKHRKQVSGKKMFVIGSEQPWLEVLLLHAGAAHVTTIEYGKIHSEDPRITTMTPAELREKFIATGGKEPRFDGGATYSSIEHAGLGRYGERLNPWGDLQAMAKAWCITKPGGAMFVGVPSAKEDVLYWNAHRVYGPKRWPQLMANWHQVDKAGIPGEPGSPACLQGNACQDMVLTRRVDEKALDMPV